MGTLLGTVSLFLFGQYFAKQYYNEMYKFGSATRGKFLSYFFAGCIWTADNGKLPPWKGIIITTWIHNSVIGLRMRAITCLRGWISEYIVESAWHLQTLYSPIFWNRGYECAWGLNTLTGEPMGGWIQYAMSQTAGAWLAQHFICTGNILPIRSSWKKELILSLKDVAAYMEQNSIVDSKGFRRLSSAQVPKFMIIHCRHGSRIWQIMIYRWCISCLVRGAEMANELGIKTEAAHWNKLKSQFLIWFG